MKTHYDTLGVTKDASHDDIKSSFRKLSKETHPDVGGSTANTERFKTIAHAASILTNPTKREAYDREVESASMFGRGLHRAGEGFEATPGMRRPSMSMYAPNTPVEVFVHNLMRPRTFLLGTVAIFTTIYVSNALFGPKHSSMQDETKVQARKNPETGRWEQPAPWDPTYRRLKPALQMIPRDQVTKRNR